jgi:transposase InsO family protein
MLRGRQALVLENLLLRQQLAVALRARPRPRLRRRDRVFWVVARRLWCDWGRHLVLVRPEPVLRWPRRGWRLFWRWTSRPRLGRPRLRAEWRELIAAMAQDNPRWGSELLAVGIAVSKRSIQRYRRRGPARPPSQSWRTFLGIHADAIWAADLLTVQALTFKVLYVLVVMAHGRRELVHVNVTAHPAAGWVWRQVVEATAWGRRPRFLLRDRDAVYGGDFAKRTEALGVETLLAPVRAPRANAIAERAVGTLRRECPDHLIVLSESHVRTVLAEFTRFSNRDRPHRALQLQAPRPAACSTGGPIQRQSGLGGLHHVYERAA